MKLTELAPKWYSDNDSQGRPVGLTFLCPCCKNIRLGVAFHYKGIKEIRNNEPDTHGSARPCWHITGDSFENVTLTPSVDVSAFGHWHGFITNGEVK